MDDCSMISVFLKPPSLSQLALNEVFLEKKQNQQQTAENDHEKKHNQNKGANISELWSMPTALFPISSWADILTPQTWDKSPISLNWTVQVRKWQSDSPSL